MAFARSSQALSFSQCEEGVWCCRRLRADAFTVKVMRVRFVEAVRTIRARYAIVCMVRPIAHARAAA